MLKVTKQSLLFCLIILWSTLVGAQTENANSAFNGTDYYFGWIVPGFGGGFEQVLNKRLQDSRHFSTIPSLYGGIKNKVAVQVFNKISWIKDNEISLDNGLTLGQKNFTNYTPRFQAYFRPIAGFHALAYGDFSEKNSVLSEFVLSEFQNESMRKVKNQNYGLQGMYFSQNGFLELNPAQLTWVHYGNTKLPFMESTFEQPVLLLSQGQKMISFSMDFHNQNLNTFQPNSSTNETTSKARTYLVNLDFLHGLKNNLVLGFSSIYDYEQESQNIDRDNKLSITFAPRLDYLVSYKTLHRFQLEYDYLRNRQTPAQENSSSQSPNASIATKNFLTKLTLRYAFHRLWNIDSPSLDTFLANWNNDFGNRLRHGAFHLRTELFFNSERFRNERQLGEVQSFSNQRNQSFHISTATSYGLFNWVEINWKTELNRRWGRGAALAQWNNRISWRNSFALNFGNYRYSERFKERFGWHQIRAFDQLYQPLLYRGLVTGSLALQPNYFAREWRSGGAEYFDYRLPNQQVETWFLETEFRYGILDNLELKASGVFNSPFVSVNLKDRIFSDIHFSLAWQIWESFRFEIEHGVERTDSPDFVERENFWNLRILSLL